MLEQIFGPGEYYNYPSFEVAIFSLLLSFVLSGVIGLVYWFTYSGKNFPNHFFQAIVLSSTVSSMVIMAVGNNLAAGFGIIGAIAIIRFRTLVRDPRNIIFIFASLSVGIATGVYGYAIAISGTVIFCVIAIALHFSSFGIDRQSQVEVSFSLRDRKDLHFFEQYCKQASYKVKNTRIRKNEELNNIRYSYIVIIPSNADPSTIYNKLDEQEDYLEVRIDIPWEVEL